MVCLVEGNVRTQEGKSMKSCCFCRVQDGGLKTFDDVLTHLNGLGLFNMDMGLARMKGTLEKLGLTVFPVLPFRLSAQTARGLLPPFCNPSLWHTGSAPDCTRPRTLSAPPKESVC